MDPTRDEAPDAEAPPAPAETAEHTENTPLLTQEGAQREAALRTWLRDAKQAEEQREGGGRWDNVEWKGIPATRWLLGIGYMAAMAVCGIVLVALGSSLEDLAENCGTTSVEVGTVFVARGAGAMFGSASSAKVYKMYSGTSVMCSGLFFLAVVLTYMPFLTSTLVLHLCFGALGVCTAMLDTGCQIMTRKLHGREAGPWLGANTVAFGVAGAIVPLISYLTGSLFAQYAILAVFSAANGVLIYITPQPLPHQIPPPAVKKTTAGGKPEKQTYEIEMVLSVMVFWLVGGKVTSTAYFTEFVEETDLIPYDDATLLICVLWTAITLGRVAGIQDMRFLDLSKLYNHLLIFLVGGIIGMGMIALFPSLPLALWVGVGLYGFFNGPTVGYIYDLNNRATVPSELGMSIVMLGLNCGASLVPYGTSLLWEYTGAYSLIYIIMFSHIVPIPLMYVAKYIFENKQIKKDDPPVADSGISKQKTSTRKAVV
uniref:Major facilitator superfamily (MFS) profile domain-containing protein n=1 Tax=Heterosigma akashiwo TaxID=2829 RepID=A0A7S3UWT4_HETAK